MVKIRNKSTVLPKIPSFRSLELPSNENTSSLQISKSNNSHAMNIRNKLEESTTSYKDLIKAKYYEETNGNNKSSSSSLISSSRQAVTTNRENSNKHVVREQLKTPTQDSYHLYQFHKERKNISKCRPKTSMGMQRGLTGFPVLRQSECTTRRPASSQITRSKHKVAFGSACHKNDPIGFRKSYSSIAYEPKENHLVSKQNCKPSDEITTNSHDDNKANFLETRKIAFERVAKYKRAIQRTKSLEKQADEKKRALLLERRKEIATRQSRRRAEAYAVNAVMKDAFDRHFAALLERKKSQLV